MGGSNAKVSDVQRWAVGLVKTGKTNLCRAVAVAVACLLPLACTTTPTPWSGADPSLASSRGPTDFSGEAARQHLRALNEVGGRVTGPPGADATRAVLREALSRAGVSNREYRTQWSGPDAERIEFTHVLASVPGRSNDVILLAAHFDPLAAEPDAAGARPGVGDPRASGVALLLELARVLHAGEPPDYTIGFAFIDGDGTRLGHHSAQRPGTRSLVEAWSRTGELETIRIAVFFGAVGASDLPMLRDIDSPRVYRELFWEAARNLDLTASFPASSPYGRADTGRTAFAELARRSSIALQDAPAPLPAEADDVLPAPRGASVRFDEVGRVTLEALGRVAAKLRRIDRFARSPLTAGREPTEPPAARP